MLAPRYAAQLRRERLQGLLVLSVSGLLLAAIATAVVLWPSGWVGAVAAALGLLVIMYWTSPIARAKPKPIYPIYDRPVVRDEAPDDFEERRWLRVHLALRWSEIDARLIELGLEPLDRYFELRVAPGIARHDPAVARRNIESLLAHPGPTLDPMTCRALELLVQDLDDAARAGARFCWMPVSAWSGVIETNLRLYLG